MSFKNFSVVVLSFTMFILFSFSAYAENVIKLGSAIAFTGPLSRSGKLYIDSYKMAVDQVNKNGGVNVNGKKYKFELVFYDDKSDSTESARLVEKLITEDKVNFLLGPYSSGITIPNSIVARRYRVPMIEGGGSSGKIFNRGNKYIFGTLPSAADDYKSSLEFLKKQNPTPQKVAILYADDKYSMSVGEGAKKDAENMGFDVVLFEKYTEGASDFTSIITKAKKSGAEVALVAGHTEESMNFVQQSAELDYSPKFLSLSVGPSSPDFRKALGKNAEYIYSYATWSPTMSSKGYIFKNNQSFVEKFKERFGYDPDYHNASGIADIAIYKYAIEKAGTLDREAVRDAIASISNLETIYGTIDFKENGQIDMPTIVLQIQNGKIHQVYPTSDIEAVYPMPAWDNR